MFLFIIISFTQCVSRLRNRCKSIWSRNGKNPNKWCEAGHCHPKNNSPIWTWRASVIQNTSQASVYSSNIWSVRPLPPKIRRCSNVMQRRKTTSASFMTSVENASQYGGGASVNHNMDVKCPFSRCQMDLDTKRIKCGCDICTWFTNNHKTPRRSSKADRRIPCRDDLDKACADIPSERTKKT